MPPHLKLTAHKKHMRSTFVYSAKWKMLVNWNDTTISSLSHHQTKLSPIKRKMSNGSNNDEKHQNTKSLFSSASSSNYSQSIGSPTSSTLSFEYIKSLSSLVNSILEPKLLNKLSYTGVDIR